MVSFWQVKEIGETLLNFHYTYQTYLPNNKFLANNYKFWILKRLHFCQKSDFHKNLVRGYYRIIIQIVERNWKNHLQWCRNQEGGAGSHLADQLTLFQPGEGRLSPPITTGTPMQCFSPSGITGIHTGITYDKFDRCVHCQNGIWVKF